MWIKRDLRPSYSYRRPKKRVGSLQQRLVQEPEKQSYLYAFEAQYSRHMILSARLVDKETKIMIDSGAIRNYISSRCVKQYQIETCNKSKSYQLALADGSATGQTGRIDEETIPIFLKIGKHKEIIVLDIVNIKYDIILGIPWLEHHDPMIN